MAALHGPVAGGRGQPGRPRVVGRDRRYPLRSAQACGVSWPRRGACGSATASPAVLALGANAVLIAVLPFSTFREPLALVRLATGLVLSTVLFGAHVHSRRVLNYSLFWMAALVLLVRG